MPEKPEVLAPERPETLPLEKRQVLLVNITLIPPADCEAVPDFVAMRGSTVVFRFDEFPNADIVFEGASPFASTTIKPGKHIVRADALSGRTTYKVSWDGVGSGNGSGEVIP